MRRPRRVLPAFLGAGVRSSPEALALLPFVAVFLGGVVAGLPLNLPDSWGVAFVERHYFRPLVMALGLQALVLLLRRRPGARRWFDLRLVATLTALVTISIFLHFNFKAWMPLVHSRMFDAELAITDSVFGHLVPVCIELRRSAATAWRALSSYDIDRLYHDAFVMMFFLSFSIHALLDPPTTLRRMVIASTLVLLVGGVLYWVMPAQGPFMFRRSESALARIAQGRMSSMFSLLVQTRQVPAGYFAAPPAAMPSLHTAHALLFTIFAARYHRWLLFAYVPLVLWILIEAVAASWHYFLDLPAGAVLAVFCIMAADRLLPDRHGGDVSEASACVSEGG